MYITKTILTNMSTQPPDFRSEIPESLLLEVPPHTKWLMEEVSKIGQATKWNTSELVKQSEKLDSIEEQCKKTNGRVLKLEDTTKDHQSHISNCPVKQESMRRVSKIEDDIKWMKWAKCIVNTRVGKLSGVVLAMSFVFLCVYLYNNFSAIPLLMGKVFSVF